MNDILGAAETSLNAIATEAPGTIELPLTLVLLALTVNTLARQLSHRYVTVEIGDNECDVHDFGAKGDGKTDDTMVTLFVLLSRR